MVLITGGGGAVGRHLAQVLFERGERVRSLGWAEPEGDARLRELGAEVFHGDIRSASDLEASVSGCGTVIHLAALLSCPEHPSRFREINVEGTRRVLEAAGAAGVGHFIFVSSISVLYPRRNPYSASKAEAEECVRSSGIPYTVVRPCLVLDGAGGGAEYRAFAQAAARFPVLFLPRRGQVWKRPIHVRDLAEALAEMAGNPRCYGKTYPLGGSRKVSLAEMARASDSGQGRPILPIPGGLLRAASILPETASRLLGRKLTWLCRQSVDGLIHDAEPDMSGTFADLEWRPREFRPALGAEMDPVSAGAAA